MAVLLEARQQQRCDPSAGVRKVLVSAVLLEARQQRRCDAGSFAQCRGGIRSGF